MGTLDTARLEATQPPREAVCVYFARRASRRLTPSLLRLRLSANQITAVWGLLGLLNACMVYLVIVGHHGLIVAVWALHVCVEILDCADGEVARYRGTASPIGGKLLDGVWHRLMECALLIAYAAAVFERTHSNAVLPIALLMFSADTLYTYVYERRVTVIRLHARSGDQIIRRTSDEVCRRNERWRDFSWRKKRNAVAALLPYRSVCFMIALSFAGPAALSSGLVAMTALKHYRWVTLLLSTIVWRPALAPAALPTRAAASGER